jgi:hypothetical protein
MKQKKTGRPEKFNEETTVISFRVPVSKAEIYREKIHRVISRLKNLRTLILIPLFFMSCSKEELPQKTCYVCEVQNYGIRKSVDVCLLPGEQFSFTENGLSWKCKLKTN